VNYINYSNINEGIRKNAGDYINLSEEVYFNRLAEAAHNIHMTSADKPLVLLSGPSGSGKTTSAIRIQKILEAKGMSAITISMDNYFLPADAKNLPRLENGEPDYESPYRLDISLFSEHLKKLFRCEPIEIPVFNFKSQMRKGVMPVLREKNQIVIVEGIHALNYEVTGDTDDFTTCIYVSVRTRITGEDGVTLHPQNIRLLRRLSRDRLFRGRDFKEVFSMMDSVSNGERLYILPHKGRAGFDIDTFMAYEAPVYKHLMLKELEEAEWTVRLNKDYSDLISILRRIDPLKPELVPSNSLIREFIGGSSIKY
jgi:uridine kinase